MSTLTNRHPNHRYSEMTDEELQIELSTWSRLDLINWLSWNDPNGIYRDEQALDEVGEIMSKEEGIEIMMRQVRG